MVLKSGYHNQGEKGGNGVKRNESKGVCVLRNRQMDGLMKTTEPEASQT